MDPGSWIKAKSGPPATFRKKLGSSLKDAMERHEFQEQIFISLLRHANGLDRHKIARIGSLKAPSFISPTKFRRATKSQVHGRFLTSAHPILINMIISIASFSRFGQNGWFRFEAWVGSESRGQETLHYGFRNSSLLKIALRRILDNNIGLFLVQNQRVLPEMGRQPIP